MIISDTGIRLSASASLIPLIYQIKEHYNIVTDKIIEEEANKNTKDKVKRIIKALVPSIFGIASAITMGIVTANTTARTNTETNKDEIGTGMLAANLSFGVLIDYLIKEVWLDYLSLRKKELDLINRQNRNIFSSKAKFETGLEEYIDGEIKSAKEPLETDLDAKAEEIKKINDAVDTLTANSSTLESQNRSLVKENKDLSEAKSELEKENKVVNDEIAQLVEKKKIADNRVNQLSEEKNNLQKRLDEVLREQSNSLDQVKQIEGFTGRLEATTTKLAKTANLFNR